MNLFGELSRGKSVVAAGEVVESRLAITTRKQEPRGARRHGYTDEGGGEERVWEDGEKRWVWKRGWKMEEEEKKRFQVWVEIWTSIRSQDGSMYLNPRSTAERKERGYEGQ